MVETDLVIIGGGLAGAEAAWQVTKRGIKAVLYEMRPTKSTPVHKTSNLAELVCSNSLRSASLLNAVGLLKEEMRLLDSLIMRIADETKVPAGKALAVDREQFSQKITETLEKCNQLKIIRKEITHIPEDIPVIIATGPLTSDRLTEEIQKLANNKHLYFYDAIAPIVDAETINYDIVFEASRYEYENEKGDYLNCPLSKDEYYRLREEILKAEKVPLREFENPVYFEGCLPIEVLAERGVDTLRFGSMKPVGIINPKTGKRPFAIVQLRQENQLKTIYNMVGFQTRLKWGEQERIFRMIPGLEKVEFVRLGSLHRNTFINSPELLKKTLQFNKRDNLFFAGQITGVEGYIESTAMGLIAGINISRLIKNQELTFPPETTACGALINHITNTDNANFQPMNINFGILPPIKEKNKQKRKEKIVDKALADLKDWIRLSKINTD